MKRYLADEDFLRSFKRLKVENKKKVTSKDIYKPLCKKRSILFQEFPPKKKQKIEEQKIEEKKRIKDFLRIIDLQETEEPPKKKQKIENPPQLLPTIIRPPNPCINKVFNPYSGDFGEWVEEHPDIEIPVKDDKCPPYIT